MRQHCMIRGSLGHICLDFDLYPDLGSRESFQMLNEFLSQLASGAGDIERTDLGLIVEPPNYLFSGPGFTRAYLGSLFAQTLDGA